MLIIVLLAPCVLSAQTNDETAGSRIDETTLSLEDDESAADEAEAARRERESLLPIDGDVQSSSSSFAALRMFFVLILVAVVIYLVIFCLKRLSRPRAEQNPHLRILASTHLGSGRYIHVVSVGTNAWLVGSGEGGVTRIADVTDREAVDAMIVDNSAKSAEALTPLPSFRALLKKLGGGGTVEQNRLDNLRQRRERFRKF
ncbi:MAG: flagellar biosynthetic protein FliO [Treponema sp.]|nr:flagellar biosynthetic protein FliO [Treponema sp.]